MLKSLFIPLVVLATTPALGTEADFPQGPETRIPRINQYLEWVADGKRGVFIQADTGRWYYARTQARCSRLRQTVAIGFIAPRNELDRYGALRVEGWRCPLVSVVETVAPPGHEDH